MKERSLSRIDRITGKKEFSLVFQSGIPVSTSNTKIRALYTVRRDTEQGLSIIKIAVAISKKAGNAVWRNRVRRLIKESFRLNKVKLSEHCANNNLSINLVFLPVGLNKKYIPKMFLNDISPLVDEITSKLIEKVQ